MGNITSKARQLLTGLLITFTGCCFALGVSSPALWVLPSKVFSRVVFVFLLSWTSYQSSYITERWYGSGDVVGFVGLVFCLVWYKLCLLYHFKSGEWSVCAADGLCVGSLLAGSSLGLIEARRRNLSIGSFLKSALDILTLGFFIQD
eukprot:TRINITY_DN4120_c0_g1_i1.p1 TRINITY_DN4120_c0_g1~~TRINITY_DN4120_c0_g1_i1.p1  ORF type:complete len:147 (-),score=15.00 TRINITY_DN4120_c0_g1_i1:27-467(-)